MSERLSLGLVLAIALALAAARAGAEARGTAIRAGGDWTRFGYDAGRHNSGPARTGITAANVGWLRQQRVALDGTVDSSPIYLRGATVGGGRHDVFVVTTSYGKTIAVDADSGSVLWRFTPQGYASWAGSYRITNSTPVADPGRRFVYSASPDGRIHKLALATGREVESGGWPVAITREPRREKIAPALNFARGLVLAATGGYVGDAPPYQGHVVAVAAGSGRIVHVWNALCSDRRELIEPSSCSESGAAIWARSGVVVEPSSGRLLVATGDGRFDGRSHWGDSVLMLSPDAGRLLRNWTPHDYASLDSGDVDLGSTAPALLTRLRAVQGGKDGKLRFLDLGRLNGRTSVPGPRTGGELQTVTAPGVSGLFSAPAVWRNRGRIWLFVANGSGTTAFSLRGGRLRISWRNRTGGTSPIAAGGLLYVYDDLGGALNVYRPVSGRLLVRLPGGPGHWNSPIVTDGRIALPEGDANQHRTSGVLDIYRLP
ncbi:MAG: outer membrane protein assembly factor BamB family protein [Gaiellaceae bacterium]